MLTFAKSVTYLWKWCKTPTPSFFCHKTVLDRPPDQNPLWFFSSYFFSAIVLLLIFTLYTFTNLI